jgi:alpha-L-fucosidase
VVREFVDACRAEGLGVGLYLSPWDRHEPSYGDSARYNNLYCDQLTELLTGYGPLVEVWFDGANGEGPNGRRQVYDWARYHGLIRRHQPGALIFSDAGPDIRWIGNERGEAGDPNWCTVRPEAVPYPGASGDEVTTMLQHGDPEGTVWRPGEADVSIRPGWFWHPAEDDRVRTGSDLMALYFSSVGRNANLLLNVPPTRAGLLHASDVRALADFGARRERLRASDMAVNAATWSTPMSYELQLARPARFDVVSVGEDLAFGQRVSAWAFETFDGSRWIELASGTTIGHQRLIEVAPTVTDRVRVRIDDAIDPPSIGELGLLIRSD